MEDRRSKIWLCEQALVHCNSLTCMVQLGTLLLAWLAQVAIYWEIHTRNQPTWWTRSILAHWIGQ